MQDNNVWFECFWQGWILIHIHSYQRTIFFRHPSIFCSLHRCNIFGRVGRWLGQIGRWLCYHLIYMLRNGWTFFSKSLRWISNEKSWHERDHRINSPRQNRGLTPKSSEENKGNFFVLINPYFNDSLTIVHIAVRTFWVTVEDNIGGVTARPRINIRQLPSCQRYN